jgi:tRNA G26 N,N-dimethylase Trm1
LDKLSAKLTLPAPPVATILKALEGSGFQAVQTHFNSRAIKTNASAHDMQQIVKSVNFRVLKKKQ